MGQNVELAPTTEDVLAEKALRVCVGNGFLHNLEQVPIFTAEIDEAQLRTDC